MLEHSDAEVVRASVKGLSGNVVLTDIGEFEGRCIIDCTGWRAVLANSFKRQSYAGNQHNKEGLSFGIETVLPYSDDKLHFYWCPNALKKGVIWVFPVGKETRFGIGSYVGERTLKDKLGTFLNDFNLEIDRLHGGYFPHRLREPTVGHIFLVGDSAGQCLPLTGEGIRTALYFGEKCGRIVQRIIDQQITLEDGLAQYRNFVFKHRHYFTRLLWLQRFFSTLPPSWMNPICSILSKKAIFSQIMREYENFALLSSPSAYSKRGLLLNSYSK